MNPLVSIVATFYNSEQFIFNAMNCLLNQTYKNIEFICVNDGSTDKTNEILREYKEKDSRIVIITKENEKAAHYARAAGQDIAKGKYCFLFDHDDTISTDLIESAVKKLEATNHDMVSPTVIHNKHIFKLSKTITGKEAFTQTIGGWKIHLRSIMKREIFQSVSFRDLPHAIINGDEYIDRKILLNVNTIGACEGTYYYTPPDSSETRKTSLRLIEALETDIFLRDLLIEKDFYNELGYIFEIFNLKHLLKMTHLLLEFKSKSSKKEYDEKLILIRSAYDNLNKKLILKNTPNSSIKLYYSLILSGFPIFINSIKLKNKIFKKV